MRPLKKSNGKLFMNKILLIMVMMILSGPAVFAEMRGPGMGMGMGMRYGYGLGACGDPELHLSPDQAEKVSRLQHHYLEEVRQLQRQLMLKRAELKVMDSSLAEDTTRLDRKRLEIQELREKIQKIWLNYKMDCRALLTSEQLEQLGPIENGRRHRPGIDWGNR